MVFTDQIFPDESLPTNLHRSLFGHKLEPSTLKEDLDFEYSKRISTLQIDKNYDGCTASLINGSVRL